MFKGTGYDQALFGLGATDYAGWGFNATTVGPNADGEYEVQPVYSLDQANAATDQQLRTTPVFRPDPAWLVGANALSQTQIDEMLGMGIPVLTPSTGRTELPLFDPQRQFNLNSTDPNNENFKPNGWPMDGHSSPDADMWLHNDIKDVAYFFNYKLFDKITVEGGLE